MFSSAVWCKHLLRQCPLYTSRLHSCVPPQVYCAAPPHVHPILLLQESRVVAEMALPHLELQPLVRQTTQAECGQGWDQTAGACGDGVKSRVQRWQVSHLCLMMMQNPLPQVTFTQAASLHDTSAMLSLPHQSSPVHSAVTVYGKVALARCLCRMPTEEATPCRRWQRSPLCPPP